MTAPYLSVVAASRNDDHGGDPLARTQIFINNLARQCERYHLRAELIIVDWNSVPDRPGLAAVLSLPEETTYCNARVITVPSTLHCRLKYADKLAFFQMIAKNVGIRRARGNFILATNIDIIFSDELIRFISEQKLDRKHVYRVDRYDIRSGLSIRLTLEETLAYAWDNGIRAHRRYQPEQLVQHLYGNELFKKFCVPAEEFRGRAYDVVVASENEVWTICPKPSANMDHLHTNGCGDFTLLSREGWDAIRGYPEFEAFSFNIDSIGLLAAHYSGYQEISLLPPCVCFHIEHEMGSGWTPEGEQRLFNRLREAEILNPEWPVLTPLVDQMREQGKALEFNHSRWGMADFDLPEQALGDRNPIPTAKLEQLALQGESYPVSAIKPTYDLDRLTLLHERRRFIRKGAFPLSSNEFMAGSDEERVVLYIPDSSGGYSETHSLAYYAQLTRKTIVNFRLESFSHQFPLRFDPCQRPGLVTIDAINVFDLDNNRPVLTLEGDDARKLVIGGTAVWLRPARRTLRDWRQMGSSINSSNGRKPLYIISTGSDPQIILPRLPNNVGFPLIVSVQMEFLTS